MYRRGVVVAAPGQAPEVEEVQVEAEVGVEEEQVGVEVVGEPRQMEPEAQEWAWRSPGEQE